MSTNSPTDGNERGDPGRVPPAEDVLAAPIQTRDLGMELAARPRRRGIPTSTGALVAIVLLAIGFFGGLLVGRHTASDQTVAAPGSFPTPGGGPPAGSMAGFTTGTVSRVDGETLYLETSDGDTVKVVTDGDTQIQVSEDAKLGDLPTGSTVVVQGTSNDEGVVEATRISEGDLGPGGLATAAGSG